MSKAIAFEIAAVVSQVLGTRTRWKPEGTPMNDCSFEKLVLLLERKLSTNAQLRLFDHLDRCEICRDTIYHISRDRDEALRILLPRGSRKAARTNAASGVKGTVVPVLSKSHRPSSQPPATGTLG